MDKGFVLHSEEAMAIYAMLRECRPFKRWGLPHAEQIVFRMVKDKHVYAEWLLFPGEKHVIRISIVNLMFPPTVTMYMAHEMIHAAQHILGTDRGLEKHPKNPYAGHNADFHRRADKVCQIWGWDRRLFV